MRLNGCIDQTCNLILCEGFKQEKEDLGYAFRYTELNHDLSSDENFGIAQDWIRDCCTDHDSDICPALVNVDLPTRLIDVGKPPKFEILRLTETSPDEKGQYLALSHCWGPPESKKLLTTTGTLKSRLAFIDVSDMPPNFSDAVVITRKLGYRFLWIDSLCIIQDSKSDWETESQNMGRIYTNAALTIAAAAATSSDGGLLKKSYQPISDDQLNPSNWFLESTIGRTHLFIPQPNTNIDASLRSTETQSSRNIYRMKLSRDDEDRNIILEPLTLFSDMEENWFRITSGGPLSQRGWCLQERLLSRRILYYGTRQIYWQCASSRRAADGEDVPISAARSQANLSNEVSEWPDVLGLKKLNGNAIGTGSFDQHHGNATEIYRTWHAVLFLYINRRLTYYSDRLPGLAGMATLIHELSGDQYVAGFWRKNLLVDLIWSHTNQVLREDAPRPIAERYELEKPEWEKATSKMSGPSWSWCSHDFTDLLQFLANHNEEYRSRFWQGQDAEIIDVKIELAGNNPFGQVMSGELVIRGFTYPRWDVRALEESDFQQRWRFWSSFILGICPHSPWLRNRSDSASPDQKILWDYWPRQTLSPSKRVWIHLFRWFIDLCKIVPRQGMAGFYRKRVREDCGACNQYLCMHVLSIVDKEPGRDGQHEIDLWSLVLEPVPGQMEKYRRVGVARKAAYISEQEFLDSKASGMDSKIAPKAFDGWQFREIVVI